MKKILILLLLITPFIGFGQVNDKWNQKIISGYNLYVDNIFDFQVKIHNSLCSGPNSSYYTKYLKDEGGNFNFEISVDGVDVFPNKETGDPRLVGGVEIDFFNKSFEDNLKSKEGISYKIKKDDFYVISGSYENITFYHKTIFNGWFTVTVNLKYNKISYWSEEIKKEKLKLFSEMCEQIHNSLK